MQERNAAHLFLPGSTSNITPLFQVHEKLYRFCPETQQWRTSSKLLTPRYSAASAILGSQMVISGGQDKARVLGTVEAADVERGWVAWPELPHARKYHSMAAVRRFAFNPFL